MTRPRVKICGITRESDAQFAVELGADAIGFVFWRSSPRAIDAGLAKAIAAGLPSDISRVGVFVDPIPDEVAQIAGDVSLDLVQLHGDEEVDTYAGCGVPLLKAIAVRDEQSCARAIALPPAVTVLIDAHAPVERGGTGQLANWAWANRVSGQRRVILAGGLTAANLNHAVETVRPWAIDVSSGVEDAPGIKNHAKLRSLFEVLGPAASDARGLR